MPRHAGVVVLVPSETKHVKRTPGGADRRRYVATAATSEPGGGTPLFTGSPGGGGGVYSRLRSIWARSLSWRRMINQGARLGEVIGWDASSRTQATTETRHRDNKSSHQRCLQLYLERSRPTHTYT